MACVFLSPPPPAEFGLVHQASVLCGPRGLPRVKAFPPRSLPSQRALIGEQWGVLAYSGGWGVGWTVVWGARRLAARRVYTRRRRVRYGDAGREERGALWGERSERAGGGEAPKRRWLSTVGTAHSGKVQFLYNFNFRRCFHAKD